MSHSLEHRDVTGRLIGPGDYIAFAAVDGRSAVLRLGEVIELCFSKKSIRIWNGTDFLEGHNATLRIRGVRKGWKKDEPWEPHEKEVVLQFPDRVAIIPVESIPVSALNALALVGLKRR
jgi:hypothetical protein